MGVLEHLAQHGTPASGVARRIDVGSDLYLRFLETEVFEQFVERGASACRFYEGEYGAGKTHLLQLIAEMALARGAAVVQSDLSQSLHLGDWRGLLQHLLANLRVDDSSGVSHRGLPAILADLGWDDSMLDSLASLRVPHAGFRDAMYHAAAGDLPDHTVAVLARFLLGEPITVSELRRSGVGRVKGSVTDRNAERVLQTLGLCLRCLGVSSLVVLFDEAEHTLGERPGPREIRAANLMRRMVDGATNGRLAGMFFGIAVLPGTIQQAALVYPALGQRISAMSLSPGGYRRPVLHVGQLSTCAGPEEFLDLAIAKVCQLASEIGPAPDNLPETLRKSGRRVLQEHASGYRRPLLKQLAMTAVMHV